VIVATDDAGAGPTKRYGAAGGIAPGGASLLVSHGFSSSRFSDSWALDLAAMPNGTGVQPVAWRRVRQGISSYSATLPHARCLVASTVVAGPAALVMYGGCLSGGGAGGPCPARDVWSLDPGSAAAWTRGDSGPTPRVLAAMAVHPVSDMRAMMYSGDEKFAQGLAVSRASPVELDSFDPATGTWERELAATPRGAVTTLRRSHTMAKLAPGLVFVFGGRNLKGGAHLADALLISGASDPAAARGGAAGYFSSIMLHAIFMFLGWGVLLQAGHISARYFRRFDPTWFKVHRAVQTAGLVLVIAGLITISSKALKPHFAFAHGAIGLAVVLVGVLQPLNAFFRPHDKTSPARQKWRWLHFGLGRVANFLAVLNMWLGIFLAQAPVWVIGLLGAYTGLLGAAYLYLEISKIRGAKASDAAEGVPVETQMIEAGEAPVGSGSRSSESSSANDHSTSTTTATTASRRR
jgi:hypothetical protein